MTINQENNNNQNNIDNNKNDRFGVFIGVSFYAILFGALMACMIRSCSEERWFEEKQAIANSQSHSR